MYSKNHSHYYVGTIAKLYTYTHQCMCSLLFLWRVKRWKTLISIGEVECNKFSTGRTLMSMLVLNRYLYNGLLPIQVSVPYNRFNGFTQTQLNNCLYCFLFVTNKNDIFFFLVLVKATTTYALSQNQNILSTICIATFLSFSPIAAWILSVILCFSPYYLLWDCM